MKKQFQHPHLAQRLALADEATALLRGEQNREIAGVSEQCEKCDALTVHRIRIFDQRGSSSLGRPCGNYITIDLPQQGSRSEQNEFPSALRVVAHELSSLLPPLSDGLLLIVGLGNPQVIADSLGPRCIDRCYATQQLFRSSAAASDELISSGSIGRVCALAPGVEGISGINSCELISALCRRLQPAAVVAVDALAAASVRRVGCTVQINDSGMRPGSGLGQSSGRLDAELLGCPVAAIGVPTVVDSAAIIGETAAALAEYADRQQSGLTAVIEDEAALEYAEQRLLDVFQAPLLVTPKDIDRLIERQATLIAAACAVYAHPGCSVENYSDFIR